MCRVPRVASRRSEYNLSSGVSRDHPVMRIASSDNLAAVTLEIIERDLRLPSFLLAMELRTPRMTAAGKAWIGQTEALQFLLALGSIGRVLGSEASLESLSPGQLSLRFYSLDSLSHIALTVSFDRSFLVNGRRVPFSFVDSLEVDV